MVASIRSIASLAVLSGLANAKLYAVPEATTTFNLPLDQFSPQPTKAPAYADLRRRQTSAATTVLVAPDNTCGYISGRAGAAYTCGTAASCIFFTSTSRVKGFVACCDADDCGARRTCYDARQISSSSVCDNGCMVDKYTLKCTNTARPYCNTISFSGSIFDYWCNTLEISTAQAAVTTFEGQTGRTWVPLALTDDATSSLRAPSASGRFTATGTGSPADPVASDPTSNNNNNNNDNDSNDNKSSTPVGAIVGGVVGGLAVIALVGLAIFLILRKKKKPAQNQNQQPPQIQPQPQMAQNNYQGGPPSQASPPNQYATTTQSQVWDHKYGGPPVAGYPQSYGSTSPPPQGGYQQPGQPGYFVAGNMVPDRADTTSPMSVSQATDNRYSTQTVAGYQPQQPPPQQQQFAQPQPTIHEAPATNDGHRGQMHELA